MNEEERAANIKARERNKKSALRILWNHGWIEGDIAAALSVPVKKVRQ